MVERATAAAQVARSAAELVAVRTSCDQLRADVERLTLSSATLAQESRAEAQRFTNALEQARTQIAQLAKSQDVAVRQLQTEQSAVVALRQQLEAQTRRLSGAEARGEQATAKLAAERAKASAQRQRQVACATGTCGSGSGTKAVRIAKGIDIFTKT